MKQEIKVQEFPGTFEIRASVDLPDARIIKPELCEGESKRRLLALDVLVVEKVRELTKTQEWGAETHFEMRTIRDRSLYRVHCVVFKAKDVS